MSLKFFTLLKETGKSYFCVTPKNYALYEPTLHFPEQLKNINHRDISLAGTDRYYSKFS